MLVTVARSALMYIDRLIRLRDVGLGQLGKYLIDEIVEELVSGGFPKLDGVGWAWLGHTMDLIGVNCCCFQLFHSGVSSLVVAYGKIIFLITVVRVPVGNPEWNRAHERGQWPDGRLSRQLPQVSSASGDGMNVES